MRSKILKLTITTLIILLPIIVLYYSIFFIKRQTKKEKTTVAPLTREITYPQDSIPQKDSFIENKINPKNFSFPKELPAIKVKNKVLNKEEATFIAKQIGFSKEPMEFNDVENGKLLIWNGDNYDMTVYLKLGKIKISPSYNPLEKIKTAPNKQINEEEKIKIAKDFLKEKIGIPENKITHTNIHYLKFEEGKELFTETNKENAEIFQINFTQLFNNIPLITSSPNNYLSYVQVIKDGTIINSEINLIEIVEPIETHKLKIIDFEDFNNKVGESVLISLNNGNINIPDVKKTDITKITIEKAEIAYLLDDIKQSEFYPVFVLTGKCKLKTITSEVKAILYLKAYSQDIKS